jgi:hypothetical protein
VPDIDRIKLSWVRKPIYLMFAFPLYFHFTSGSLADSVFAAGSYSRTVGVYSRAGALLYLLAGHKGGVTQVPHRGFGWTVELYRFNA